MLPNLHRYVPIALLAAIQSVYTFMYYRKVVFADQWDLVPILKRFLENDSWLKEVFSHHGDHFHSSAYLLMLPIAQISHWNLLYETLAIVLVNLASFYLLYRVCFRRIAYEPSKLSALVLFSISSAYFSLAHGTNLLWSWQLAVYLAIFGFAITLINFSQTTLPWLKFLAGTLGGLIASFSFSCGFAVWPAGLFLLLFHSNLTVKRRATYIISWLAIGFSTVFFFLSEMNGGFSQEFQFDFLNTVTFMLYYLGTPIAYFSRDISLLVSTIAVGCFIYLLWKSWYFEKRDAAFLTTIITLTIFSLTSGLLICFGRLELGFDQARSFRYIIFSQFFWFALLMLIWHSYSTKLDTGTRLKPIFIGLCLLLVLIYFNGQKIGRSSSQVATNDNESYKLLINATDSEKANLLSELSYPPEPILSESTATLKQHQLNFYKQ